jgi:hypothetical protein
MFEFLQEFWIPWTISNTIALIILVLAIKKTRWARWVFFILFTWACWINLRTSSISPGDYMGYAELTPIDFYKDFITGWFKENITAMVTVIAIGQGLIALGLLGKGWMVKLACIGAMIFFLCITPLGIGAGFPAPIFGIVTAYFIWKKDNLNWLWKGKELTVDG